MFSNLSAAALSAGPSVVLTGKSADDEFGHTLHLSRRFIGLEKTYCHSQMDCSSWTDNKLCI